VGILRALRLEDDHRARTIRLEIWLLDDPGLLELRDPPDLIGELGGRIARVGGDGQVLHSRSPVRRGEGARASKIEGTLLVMDTRTIAIVVVVIVVLVVLVL
jgi:hypothetical protein